MRSGIMAARLPKRRLAGLQATERSVGALEIKCLPGVAEISVDADIRGELRAELHDTFGRALEGYTSYESLPMTGDSAAHVLHWGDGRTTEPYRYDAVIVRLEVRDGTIYGVDV